MKSNNPDELDLSAEYRAMGKKMCEMLEDQPFVAEGLLSGPPAVIVWLKNQRREGAFKGRNFVHLYNGGGLGYFGRVYLRYTIDQGLLEE